MTALETLIEPRRAELERLCRRYGVKRLDLFGSAATGPFDPARSDLDFLVELGDPVAMNRADQYFGLLEALEKLFARSVDLVCASAIRNPFFRKAVLQSRVPVYAAEIAEALGRHPGRGPVRP